MLNLGAILLSGVLTWAMSRSVILSVAASALVAVVPRAALGVLRRQRLAAMEQQLPMRC